MKPRLKVAILAANAGLIKRGIETVAYELQKHMDAEVRVFGLGYAPWVHKVWGINPKSFLYTFYSKPVIDLKLYRIGSFVPFFDPNDMAVLFYTIGAFSPLRKFKPDAIINLSGPTAGVFCEGFRFIENVPFLNHMGGGSDIMLAKNYPDALVAATPFTAKGMKKKFPKLRVETIQNGADLSFYYPDGEQLSIEEISRISGIPSVSLESPTVLAVSAIDPSKKIDMLIRAMHRLGSGSLLLVGDGPKALRNKLLSMGKEMLGNRFIYLGRLPDEYMPKVFRTCDVFCHPSQTNAPDIAPVEAMASGIPVVAHNNETRKFYLGQYGGVLADLSDIEAFAKAIETAYKKGFDKRALEHVKQFSWDNIANRYMDLISNLVEERNR